MSNTENGKVLYLNDNPPSYDTIIPQQPPDVNFPNPIDASTTVITEPLSGNLEQTVETNRPRSCVIAQAGMGPDFYSERLICQYCQTLISTRVEFVEINMRAHLITLFLCLVGCWPCGLYLYCSQYHAGDFNDVEHTCPNCERFLGSARRLHLDTEYT